MSSAPTPHVSRPGGITLLFVLGLIQGVSAIILGLVLVLDKSEKFRGPVLLGDKSADITDDIITMMK